MTTRMKIFVFGSNRQGRHGKGAALHAMREHEAKYGQPSGLQGSSYAIVTKELRSHFPPVTIDEIRIGAMEFLEFAERHPEWDFEVTPIGCGLAGFRPEQIAPLFAKAPQNVKLPSVFQGLSHTGNPTKL
jgi:hypothetical protein